MVVAQSAQSIQTTISYIPIRKSSCITLEYHSNINDYSTGYQYITINTSRRIILRHHARTADYLLSGSLCRMGA